MATIHVPYGINEALSLAVDDQNLALDTDVSFPGEIKNMDTAILTALDQPVAGPSFTDRQED
jgi:hypothetical protein